MIPQRQNKKKKKKKLLFSFSIYVAVYAWKEFQPFQIELSELFMSFHIHFSIHYN